MQNIGLALELVVRDHVVVLDSVVLECRMPEWCSTLSQNPS